MIVEHKSRDQCHDSIFSYWRPITEPTLYVFIGHKAILLLFYYVFKLAW